MSKPIFEITIRVNVEKCRSKAEAAEFAQSLVDHIFETFNDDGSLSFVETEVVKNAEQ